MCDFLTCQPKNNGLTKELPTSNTQGSILHTIPLQLATKATRSVTYRYVEGV